MAFVDAWIYDGQHIRKGARMICGDLGLEGDDFEESLGGEYAGEDEVE